MNWTDAQKQTIETRNKNILVSAAAGSGKTAVLVERIKQLMLKDKVDIDRFLITTFTKSAAAEMKERLEDAIRAELGNPGVDEAFLKRQIELMPAANISTFHTFALEIVRRYFYLTDLEPGFKVGDETQVSILKREAVDNLFEGRFESDYDRFVRFLKKYSSDRNEKNIKENIIGLYDEMRSIPHYMEWAGGSSERLNTESPTKSMKLRAFIADETTAGLQTAVKAYEKAAVMVDEAGLADLYVKAAADAEKISLAARNFTAGDDSYGEEYIKNFFEDLKLNRMSVKKADQEAYNEIKGHVGNVRKGGKKILDDLKEKYYTLSLDECDEELRAMYEDTRYLVNLETEFENIFASLKRDKGVVDFDDAMHYAIEILQDDVAASECRERFLHIFIDEFQDSNMLQEEIVSKICRENNVFMVGDVKQSIYKFRLAEPEIFKRKYEEYKAEGEKSIRIDLNSNFRSKSCVTDTVNAVFEEIMDDYDEDARLHCMAGDDTPGMIPQLHIIDKSASEDEFSGSSGDEPAMIAKLIHRHIGMTIYDAKINAERPVEYRDIAVLSRTRNNIAAIEKHLNNEGIPAYGENPGGYFEATEIEIFINVLKVINNTRQDIPLISTMRSAIFNFSSKELAKIRIRSPKGSFYKAVLSYAEDGGDEMLRRKVTYLVEKISRLKKTKNTTSLEELVRELIYDTGYYDYCSGLPLGKQRTSNLRLLIEKAAGFERNSSSGLYGFLSYVEAMKTNNLSIGEAKVLGENENIVRIMTVHKSKGLEFPIVILMGVGSAKKLRGDRGPAKMHKDFGIGLPCVNRDEHWHRKTLLQKVIDAKKAKEYIEEETRILYVAMTRAKDRLLITGSVKDMERFEESLRGKKSFLDMMYDPLKRAGCEVFIHEPLQIRASERRQKRRERYMRLEERIRGAQDDDQLREIDRLLSFKYPYEHMSKVKSKYSVTEINRYGREENRRQTLEPPVFVSGNKESGATRMGSLMHLVMEKADFNAAITGGEKYLDNVIDRLVAGGVMEADERKFIDLRNIKAFFESEVGIRAANASVLEKEHEFIMQKNINGTNTIIQGIIDCYFVENGKIILLDYKNSHIFGASDEERLKELYADQINLYAEALEAAGDMEVSEAYLYIFNLKKFITVALKNTK